MSTDDQKTLPDRAPGLRLSSRGLTILFLVMFSLPAIAITIIVVTLPKAADAELQTKIQLQLEPVDDACVTVVNETQDVWKSIRMDINHAFYYLPKQPLNAGESLTVPLTWFGHKGGHRFDLAKGDVREFRISVRLPDNRRALKELEYSQTND